MGREVEEDIENVDLGKIHEDWYKQGRCPLQSNMVCWLNWIAAGLG